MIHLHLGIGVQLEITVCSIHSTLSCHPSKKIGFWDQGLDQNSRQKHLEFHKGDHEHPECWSNGSSSPCVWRKIAEEERVSSIPSQSSPSMSANLSLSPTPLTPLANIPIATSTPRSRTSLPFLLPDSPMQSSNSPNVETSSTRAPQQFQVSTPAAEDDPIYLCSEGALRSLFSFLFLCLLFFLFLLWKTTPARFPVIQ